MKADILKIRNTCKRNSLQAIMTDKYRKERSRKTGMSGSGSNILNKNMLENIDRDWENMRSYWKEG